MRDRPQIGSSFFIFIFYNADLHNLLFYNLRIFKKCDIMKKNIGESAIMTAYLATQKYKEMIDQK